jgi:hypothetical protein
VKAKLIRGGVLVRDTAGTWRAVADIRAVPPDRLMLVLIPPPAWLVGVDQDIEAERPSRDELLRLRRIADGHVRRAGDRHWDGLARREINRGLMGRLADRGLYVEVADQVYASRTAMALLDILTKKEQPS